VSRPRLLLVPEFTEIQWTIRPSLEAWAEVASYDPPGVGAEPRRAPLTRDTIAERGLEEVRDRGWQRFFVVADGWAIAPAVRTAAQAGDQVQGLALGHARLSDRLDGPRAPTNKAVYEGMTELIRNDALAFIRHGIVQATGGSVDEALAEQMVERFPEEVIQTGWEELTRAEDFGDELRALGVPMLLGKHEGCLMSTEEGYEDAVEAFPDARTVATPGACCVDARFAEALHGFARARADSA
jgi:hypothetical protein